MVHQFDPDMLPDSEFVDGELKYLVPGNAARMLDPRRTPVRVLGCKIGPGFFSVEVLDFEDKGALWDLPYEWVDSVQFARGSSEASDEEVASFQDAIERLDLPLRIPADPTARENTERRITAARAEAGDWLDQESQFLRSGSTLDLSARRGSEALQHDFKRYMTSHDLWATEDALATQWVSNPYSGEMVKGHAIVLAGLGLVEFDGRRLRDPGTLAGPMNESRRSDHIVRRLAFIREVFERLDRATVLLYRGAAFPGPPQKRAPDSLVSATFSLDVAMSLFDERNPETTGVLVRQSVPVTRLFMSYLETEQMNRQYAEAEAVLLNDPSNELF